MITSAICTMFVAWAYHQQLCELILCARHVFFGVICLRVCMNNKSNQTNFLCVFWIYLLCMFCIPVHIKYRAGNVTEFRGVAIHYNLESLMII